MQKSDSIDQLAAALALAQAEIEGAMKSSENPHFKRTYADLKSVWEACRDAITKNGLSVCQLPEDDTGELVRVTTILMHKSGQWLSGTLGMRPVKCDPQGMGSAITYARRYALAAMLGVYQTDDDGSAASTPENAPPPQRAAPTKKAVAAKDATVSLIRQWSGVAEADIVSAVRSTLDAYGIKADKDKPLTEADWKMLGQRIEAEMGTVKWTEKTAKEAT